MSDTGFLFDTSGAPNFDMSASVEYQAEYPSSVLDGGGISPAWDQLLQSSVSKGLDYFIAKDAAITQAGLPRSYPGTYFRGADGRLYQSNGLPVGGVSMQGSASGGGLLPILLIVGLVMLLKKG